MNMVSFGWWDEAVASSEAIMLTKEPLKICSPAQSAYDRPVQNENEIDYKNKKHTTINCNTQLCALSVGQWDDTVALLEAILLMMEPLKKVCANSIGWQLARTKWKQDWKQNQKYTQQSTAPMMKISEVRAIGWESGFVRERFVEEGAFENLSANSICWRLASTKWIKDLK